MDRSLVLFVRLHVLRANHQAQLLRLRSQRADPLAPLSQHLYQRRTAAREQLASLRRLQHPRPSVWNLSATTMSRPFKSFSPATNCSCEIPSAVNAFACASLPCAAFTTLLANRVSPCVKAS